MKAMENVPHFRGVFMRDGLPKTPHNIESGVVNLDSSAGVGTHWTAYYKNFNDIEYFDSFGNLKPPIEILNYLGDDVRYNHVSYQKYNQIICGKLCIEFILGKM